MCCRSSVLVTFFHRRDYLLNDKLRRFAFLFLTIRVCMHLCFFLFFHFLSEGKGERKGGEMQCMFLFINSFFLLPNTCIWNIVYENNVPVVFNPAIFHNH